MAQDKFGIESAGIVFIIKDRASMIMKNKRLMGIVLAVALLLLIPLIARFPWSRLDFVTAGVLLLGTGLLCELVMRKVNKIEYRIAICAAILIAFLLIWIELAVGIFGTPFAGS
jgi:hypothetical protein